MKRSLTLLLALTMLLAGCQKAAPAAPTEPETTGLYDPSHAVEQQTGGAVRVYPLENTDHIGLLTMGNKLLLLRSDGTGLVLQGEYCEVAAEGVTDITNLYAAVYDIYAQGLAVYQPDSKEVVVRNPQLQEVNRIQLPQDIQGEPAICLETNQIFYCQGENIRALDMETGIPRLLRSHPVVEQTLTGCYFDGKIISCQVTRENDQRTALFISTEDGTVLSEDPGFPTMETYGDRYFVRRFDDGWYQCIAGNLQDGPKSAPAYDEIATDPVLEMNGLVTHFTPDGMDATMQFIDLATGSWISRLKISGITHIVDVAATEEFVWLLVQEEEGQALYRWDVNASLDAEATTAMAPLYTAESPDTNGIAQLQARADEWGDTYGVKISLWQDAVKYAGDYQVEGEYRTYVLEAELLNLTGYLLKFPQDFLKNTLRSGDIRICLVRSIGNEPWAVTWVGGDCVILISSHTQEGEALLAAVGAAVDSHVLGNSRDYDNWEKLNPEGFTYGAAEQDESLLTGETRAFADQAGMASAVEDRRTLFYAAMGDDNEEIFASEIMQAKLRCMCEGIREAYGLEKSKDTYPWEFYLDEPMVKMEKN